MEPLRVLGKRGIKWLNAHPACLKIKKWKPDAPLMRSWFVQNPSGSRFKLYTVMSRASQDLFALRHELVRYATVHGIRAAMRQFGCARNTVRLWLHRWQDGDDSFQNHSRRPHHQPARTPPSVEQTVVAARKKAPLLDPRILLLPPLLLDPREGQYLSGPPGRKNFSAQKQSAPMSSFNS
ncbi:MAG: helix-turn-helix domain-containing protein [Puniceicoccales bacterium]|nr:helix-turn-helix domain-containing protein [Puniceicoccales bacterium]